LTFVALGLVALATAVPAQFLPGYPVENLGGGLAGTNGIPSMGVAGMLAPGDNVVFSLDNAAPNTIATLVVGSSIANVPIFGGIIIPNPEILLTATTDATGHAEIIVPWTEGLMGTTFWQWGAVDSGAVQGWSMSNAVAVTGNTWKLTDTNGSNWGKLHQSADQKDITVTDTSGQITSWAWDAPNNNYTDGQGNSLVVGGGQSVTINISGGTHAGAYSVH